VQARPDSRGYRVAKFVRRNRLAVALTSTLGVSILIGSSLVAWQAVVAQREKDRAEIEVEVDRQQAVRHMYMETMMGLAVTAKEHPDLLASAHAFTDALRKKLDELEPRFRTRSQERAAQLEAVTLQLNYDNEFEASLEVGNEYLDHLKAQGASPLQIIGAYTIPGRDLGLLSRFDESEAMRRAGMAWAPGVDANDEGTQLARLQITTDLGSVLTRSGKRAEALQVLNRGQAIALRTPLDHASHYENGFYLANYFQAFDEMQQMQAARTAQDGMLAVTTLSPDARGVYLKYYGIALLDNGRPAQAETALQASRALNTQAYGRNSLNSTRAVGLVASSLLRQGDYLRANALLDEEMRALAPGNGAVAPNVMARLLERRLESGLAVGDVAGLQARVAADPSTLSTPAQARNNTIWLLVDARALALLGRGDDAVKVIEFTRANSPAPGRATAEWARIQEVMAIAQLAARRADAARTTARELAAMYEREHAPARASPSRPTSSMRSRLRATHSLC
jgi:tetratricopeptide (TPR) repeat protein